MEWAKLFQTAWGRGEGGARVGGGLYSSNGHSKAPTFLRHIIHKYTVRGVQLFQKTAAQTVGAVFSDRFDRWAGQRGAEGGTSFRPVSFHFFGSFLYSCKWQTDCGLGGSFVRVYVCEYIKHVPRSRKREGDPHRAAP